MDQINLTPIAIDGIPIIPAAFTAKPAEYHVLEHGKWVPFSERNFSLRLRRSGLNNRQPRNGALSEVEEALHEVQHHRLVDVAMPLAGYEAGFIQAAGMRVLVTESAKVLPAEDIPWPNIKKFLTELLGEEALPHQILWWKWARENIGNPMMLPGQVCFYIGKHGVGKSLLQHNITTKLLGGKDGDPYDAMTSKTNFNSELFEYVHLVIEDRSFDRALGKRKDFGDSVKQMAVNTTTKCHPKGKPGVMLCPKWRCSVSLNDSPEDRAALPPLEPSVLDKMMIFRCGEPDFPVDMGSPQGWEQWAAILKAELPGLAFAIDAAEFGDYAAPRYGVRPWHDPITLDQEKENSPENILLEIIRNDIPIIADDRQEWEGTSTDLSRVLRGYTMPSRELVTKILGHHAVQNLGTYMGKLASVHPAITKTKVMGNNKWHIDLGKL